MHVSANATTPMEQCCILIPKVKIESYPVGLGRFLRELRNEFGGYTFDREVCGSWLEHAAGIVHDDASVVLLTVIPASASCRETLKELVASAAHDLHEMLIFVSITGGATFFVWASSEDEQADQINLSPRAATVAA